MTNKTLITTIPHSNTHGINTLAPSSTVSRATSCTEQVEKDINGSNKQSVSMMRGNNNGTTNATTINITDTPGSNTSLHPKGKITENARTEQDYVGSIPRIQQVKMSNSNDTGHSDTEKTSTISHSNADTLSNSNKTRSKGDDTQERNARHTRHKRKRDNTKGIDATAEKRLNSEGSKDDHVEGTGKGLKKKTVVLSDTRHGLNHDIIVIPSSPSHEGEYEVGVDAVETPRRASKRKRDGSRSTTQTRREMKRSNQSGSKEHTRGDTSSGDIEQVETSPRRYPKRSKHGQCKVNDNTPIDSTANKIIEDTVSEPVPVLNASERDNNNSPGSSSNVGIENNRYLHVKRVMINSDKRLPRAPAIPPLPPSATTLSAFKKLLTLRKELQSQANQVINHATNQAADQPENQNGQSSNQNALTSNPLADRLLLVSNTKQTSHEEFRNSIAYQQLLNRFKGLFTWPGFLSIVNPSFGKNSESPNQTTETPKKKKRKERQSR